MFYSKKKRAFMILKSQWFQKKKKIKLANSVYNLLLKSKKIRFKARYKHYYRRLKFRSRLFLFRYMRVVFLKVLISLKFFKFKSSLSVKVKKKFFLKNKGIYKSFYRVLYNLRKEKQKEVFLKSKKKLDVVRNKAMFLKKFKSNNKNKHKFSYKPSFLLYKKWPRKWKNLMVRWRFKKSKKHQFKLKGYSKNKYMWLKSQRKKILKSYLAFNNKFDKGKGKVLNININKRVKNIKNKYDVVKVKKKKKSVRLKHLTILYCKYKKRLYFRQRKKKKWIAKRFSLVLKRKKLRVKWGLSKIKANYFKIVHLKIFKRCKAFIKFIKKDYSVHSSISYFLHGKKKRKYKNKFWYDFHSVYKRKRKRKIIEKVTYTHKKLILFFIGLSSNVAYKKYTFNKNLTFKNLLLNLACNIIFVLRASNFLNNFYYSKHFVKREGVLVNGNVQVLPNFVLKKWDIISIHTKYRYLVFLNLLKTFRKRKVYRFSNKHQLLHIKKLAKFFTSSKQSKYNLIKANKKWYTSKFSKKLTWYDFKKNLNTKINFPKFLEVNYKLLMVIIISKPKFKYLNLPFESFIKKHKKSWK